MSQDTPGDREPTPLAARVRTGVAAFRERNTRALASVRTAWTHAQPTRLHRGLATAARNSSVYRWLTTEPDVVVVELDVGETYVLGPFQRYLARYRQPLVRAAGSAGTARLGLRFVGFVRKNLVPLASAMLLTVVLASLVLAWPTQRALVLIVHAVLLVAGGVGLSVHRSPAIVADSRTYRLLSETFAPPEPDD